ncbi:MAG: radical SAM protein, partial [Anaerolineales bacterium]|nr:radical SAM protein [Anaerolineales bacterium]
MTTGILFDIKEFAVHDGPGIRTTFFLKGCPLRCSWCHNPEGQEQDIEILHTPLGDRPAGKIYTSEEIATMINSQADKLNHVGGGITFSGGEPLQQSAFLLDVLDHISPVHLVLDTCGYADEAVFVELASRVDLVYYDLKCMQPETHRKYTGKDNSRILWNYAVLAKMGIP